ncbi:trigger factor [Teredinibacter waterburyi]|jgi:trigger factor|uniref:trigger factor n=1 Tax=Teredinibacter waterburyi TaxID=1500538 RepID=UPI00165FB413|nr:trigger factor [Teredinibacter waterburyi]
MQVSIETTSGLERRLTVGIPANLVDQEVEKRLKDAAKNVRINGFRKGKVPMKVVKQRYGAGVRQEVVGDTIQRSFYEAVQQKAVRPAGQPQIDARQLEEGKDLEYVATFEVYPEVELKDLEKLEVARLDADITDADIDDMIKTLQKNQASFVPVKRKSKKGDQVVIDFDGTVGGEPFEGGSAKDHKLELGSGAMIPGFEKGIIGMKTGESQTISVTFPEDYQVESLRGADAEFVVSVTEVNGEKLPALNDEFFAKFGITEGGEEKFRQDVSENMAREKSRASKNKVREQLLDGLLAANPVELPAALVASEIDAMRQQMVQQYGEMAKNLDLKALLPDDMFKAQAEKRTSLALLISALVSKEGIKADPAVVRSLIEDAAATYEDPQEVVNYYYNNEQLLASVEAAALEEQAVALLLTKAKVSDKKVSYEQLIKADGAEAE